MTLTTHIFIAVAATKPIAGAHPGLIFAVAIASHYLADLIPHWDYRIRSLIQGEQPQEEHWSPHGHSLRNDILRGGSDFFVGSLLALLLMRTQPEFNLWWFATAVIGGVLPDALKALYELLGRPKFLTAIKTTDALLHTKIRLGPYPLIGIPLQLAILVAAVIVII
ncbi:MAG: hypothetical protein G01um1014106_243 [Parcubacteria group bacterium Gr01-1014_106]|nr:MAG: hypothetical protein G01um1014106_243 [Parcubacteria group bacterium Gr01-1014_106]